MLRVVVESAKGLPKKRVGNPDPITSVTFKGKSLEKSFESRNCVYSVRENHLGGCKVCLLNVPSMTSFYLNIFTVIFIW